MAVGTDEHCVVIYRVFLPVHGPTYGAPRLRRGQKSAVINTHLNGSTLFVIIPGRDLQNWQLIAGGMKLPDFVEALYPGLPAILINYAIGSPRSQCVVETLKCCPNRHLLRRFLCSLEERVLKIQLGIERHRSLNVHPRKSAVGRSAAQTAIAAQDEQRVAGNRGPDAAPVNVKSVHAEHKHHGTPVQLHICRRGLVLGRYVVQIGD